MTITKTGKSIALAGASLTLAAVLGACTVASPPPGGGDLDGDPACDAIAAGLMTGDQVTEQPDGTVTVGSSTVPQSQQTRVFEQGSPVTQDFSPSRLNLETDGSGGLVRAWCG